MTTTQSPHTVEQVTEAETLRNLRDQFSAWLKLDVNEHPVWPDTGVRPFGTGDLKHFVSAIDSALARLTTATSAHSVEQVTEADVWLRSGSTVYVLMESGWRKGKQQYRNRYWFQVNADAGEGEGAAERMAEMLRGLLTTAARQPDPDALTGCADDQIWRDAPSESLRAAADRLGQPSALREALKMADREIVKRIRGDLAQDGFTSDQISDLVVSNPAIRAIRAALSTPVQEKERDKCPQCGGPTFASPNGICSMECSKAASVQDAETVERVARALHEHLSRRNVMQYLDNEEDCAGLARAALAALQQGQ